MLYMLYMLSIYNIIHPHLSHFSGVVRMTWELATSRMDSPGLVSPVTLPMAKPILLNLASQSLILSSQRAFEGAMYTILLILLKFLVVPRDGSSSLWRCNRRMIAISKTTVFPEPVGAATTTFSSV